MQKDLGAHGESLDELFLQGIPDPKLHPLFDSAIRRDVYGRLDDIFNPVSPSRRYISGQRKILET